MSLNVNNYLDIGSLIVNEIIGDPLITILLIMILIGIGGIYMSLNTKVILQLVAWVGIIFGIILGQYDLVILIVIFFIFIAGNEIYKAWTGK